MAKKLGVKYVCSNCGEGFNSWTGRCSNCGEWNTLQQQVEVSTATAGASGKSLAIESLIKAMNTRTPRLSTGMPEVDEVLGGGIVAGSVNLLAGQPPRDYTALRAKYGRRFDPQDMDHLQPIPSGLFGPIYLEEQRSK